MSIRRIPDAIWLQWPDDPEVDRSEVSWEDVTWADNAIEDTDPKYLRSTPVREAAAELLETLKAISDFWAYGMSHPDDAELTAEDEARAEQLGELVANVIAKAEGRP